jgi:uncharacterized membrane protein YbhN (UPF0104 family)
VYREPVSDPPPAPADAPAPPGRPAWARWFTLGSTAVAIVALVITVWSVGLRSLYDQLRAIGPWFAVILALEGLATFCDAGVLHGFLGRGGRRPGYGRVLEAQVAGRAINVVTPLASLGEATKVTMLMRHTDARRAVATVVRFNLSFLAVNLAFVIVGAPICAATLPLPDWLARTLWIGTAAAVAVAVVGVLVVRAGLVVSLVRVARTLRLVSRDRFDVWRTRLRQLDAITRGEGGLRSWLPGLWALPSKAIVWLSAWLVLYANGEPPSLGVMAAVASAGTLIAAAANVVPLGLGVSEGGTAALMAALGESPTLGVTIVVARRVVFLTYAAVGLLVLAADEGTHPRG